jgi:hypothetical protein
MSELKLRFYEITAQTITYDQKDSFLNWLNDYLPDISYDISGGESQRSRKLLKFSSLDFSSKTTPSSEKVKEERL